ncbi:hypothetical protein K458DRAFT_424678 [Lentithecium fluviatile CBS 122367]|uniref:Peroxin 11C n=1 Tax=Lentithecium fluviatile CBS 122367 TaxID=1168545 RepID=A0A6G1IEA8_9PLEO|nr:hypothetical protein K458DRAFT_424678 [Lentithecium fluviatile CBS 122367]
MASEPHPSASTTTPSHSTTPPPDPPSTPSPPPRHASLLSKLRTLVLRYILYLSHRADRTLVRLSALLSSPTSTDALLGTTSYTLSLLHAVLSRVLSTRLTHLATSLAEKATPVLLPGEAFVATVPAPPSTLRLANTVAATKALTAVIDDYRIFVRLWGLAGVYVWARGVWTASLGKEAGTKERWVRRVVWAQIASIVLFQVLENGAYLASKGVLTSAAWSGEDGAKREVRWWMWSSRFWAAYVALELARLAILRSYNTSLSAGATAEEKDLLGDGEKEGKLLREVRQREDWLWWRDLVSNLGYMPMTLHWSVEEGRSVLSDWGVSLLGAVAGGALLVDAWRQTA